MKVKHLIIAMCVSYFSVTGQIPERLKAAFPDGVTTWQNVPYASDTLKKHQLDIYLPAQPKATLPLLVWIHGGAWNHNDKYADMGYMTHAIKGFLERG